MGWYVYAGMATIFIAAFALFFIFHSLEQLALDCKTEAQPPAICERLNGFTMSMLIILLIIGGFVMTITGTAYVLLSAQ